MSSGIDVQCGTLGHISHSEQNCSQYIRDHRQRNNFNSLSLLVLIRFYLLEYKYIYIYYILCNLCIGCMVCSQDIQGGHLELNNATVCAFAMSNV